MLRTAVGLSILVLAVVSGSASALDLQMNGTFTMDFVSGAPGADLLGIVGHENSWSIVLHDVQFVCDETSCYPMGVTKLQNLLANSFSFQFMGPDAAILNDVVAQHFTQGGLYPHSAFFQADRGNCELGSQSCIFYIWPVDTSDGVYMQVNGVAPAGTFPDDANGCPTIGSIALSGLQAILFDRRGTNEGNIAALNDATISLQGPVSVVERSWGAIKSVYR